MLPLAIMTSADTDDRTAALLAANANFGMAEGQIVRLKQGKVPTRGSRLRPFACLLPFVHRHLLSSADPGWA